MRKYIGIIFRIVAVVGIVFGIFITASDVYTCLNADAETIGILFKVRENSHKDGNNRIYHTYTGIYTYEVKGVSYIFDKCGTNYSESTILDTVNIKYVSSNPKFAILSDVTVFSCLLLFIVMFIICLVFIVIGNCLIKYNDKPRKVEKEVKK